MERTVHGLATTTGLIQETPPTPLGPLSPLQSFPLHSAFLAGSVGQVPADDTTTAHLDDCSDIT